MHSPQRLLHCNTKPTNTQDSPQPLVTNLIHAWPERILISAELLQFSKLVRLRSRVSSLLVLRFLCIAAKEAKEAVVCNWAEELDRRQHIGAVQHDDEGNMDQSVAEVAILY